MLQDTWVFLIQGKRNKLFYIGTNVQIPTWPIHEMKFNLDFMLRLIELEVLRGKAMVEEELWSD